MTTRKSSRARRETSAVNRSANRRRNDLLPQLTVEMVRTDELQLPARNVRSPKKKHIAAIARSISEVGFVNPVLFAGGKIVDGVTRVEAARHLSLEHIPAIRVDHLGENERRILRVALNRLQEKGTWNEEVLKLEFEFFLDLEVDLEVTGFEPAEIDHVLQLDGSGFEEADPLDEFGDSILHGPTVTRLGDAWRLGDHLVLCADARALSQSPHLPAGLTASMLFTDPPYNVPIKGHVRGSSSRFEEFEEASGEMTPVEFETFLVETLGPAVSYLPPGGLLYVFMDWRHIREISEAIERLGLEVINLCVWAKPDSGMGSFYRSRHELIFVARVPGGPHRNNVELGRHGRNRSNVWEYAGATGGRAQKGSAFSLHPTVKPVRLVADALLDASVVGQTVLDPFLGSGTTLLAAERTRRRCIGIELSPGYVDTVILRWEAITGKQAVHVETGASFRELAAMRGDAAARDVAEPGQMPPDDGGSTATGSIEGEF